MSSFSTAAQSELFDTDSESESGSKSTGAGRFQAPRSRRARARAVFVRRTQRGPRAGVFAFVCRARRLTGASFPADRFAPGPLGSRNDVRLGCSIAAL